MDVQQLIDILSKIEDKSKVVYVSDSPQSGNEAEEVRVYDDDNSVYICGWK